MIMRRMSNDRTTITRGKLMDYKQLIELDGYINLWEVLPEDKHSKIAKQIWKALDDEGITLTNEAELEIRIYDEEVD